MQEQTLFYIVFTAQIVLISWFLPSRIGGRLKYVLDNYPPSEYPRLYARGSEVYRGALGLYRLMNWLVLLAGLVLLAVGVWSSGEEWLPWDTLSVLTLYLALQWAPLLMLAPSGFIYFGCKRRPEARSTRRARLQPRRLFDFVSRVAVVAAVVVYLAFIGLVLYVDQFGFPWFGGYWNLVGVTALNTLFAGAIAWQLYGRKKDPYQSYEDRLTMIGRSIRLMVFSSIVGTVFIGMTIGLRLFDLGELVPLSASLYFQLITLVALRNFRVDDVDFEVYRQEPLVA